MYRYLILFIDLWIISASETTLEPSEMINRTPLILTDKLGTFHYPKKARLTKEQKQEYYFSTKHDQHYFCPMEADKKNKDLRVDIEGAKRLEYDYCLFKKKFKKEETPFCKNEVRPFIVQKRDNRGQEPCGTGRLYKFVYVVCVEKTPMKKLLRMALMRKTPKDDIFSDVRHPHLYEVCYDNSPDVNRTLFTKHKIRSPYILRNLILDEENSLHHFSERFSTEPYGFDALRKLKTNFEAFVKQKQYEAEYIQNLMKKAREKKTKAVIDILTFELETLVPPGDFALGHWKRTTYHMLNYSPLNTLQVPLWRAVNLHVYNRLIELYDEIGDVDIFTGTYQDSSDNNYKKMYLGDDTEAGVTIPAMWWKLIYVPASKKNLKRRGLVIIMHTTGDLKPICKEEVEEEEKDVEKEEEEKEKKEKEVGEEEKEVKEKEKKRKKACDPKTWEIKFEESYYKYIYCCSVPSAYKYIDTIGQLKIPSVNDVSLFELG